jgi:hypothetical protein
MYAYYGLIEELPTGGGAPPLKLFRNSTLSGLGAGGAFFADMLGLFLLVILT